MDACLDHEDGNPPLAQLLRGERTAARGDQRLERPSFCGAAVFEGFDLRRPRRGHLGAEPLDFIDAAGFSETGMFGEGEEWRAHGVGTSSPAGSSCPERCSPDLSICTAAYST